MDATPAKRCTQCGEVKPLDAFYADSRTPGRWLAACKDCKKAAVKKSDKRRYDAWRAEHPLPPRRTPEERKEHSRLWHRQWAQTHPEQVVKKRNRYYLTHRSSIAAHKAKYYRSRPKEGWTAAKRLYWLTAPAAVRNAKRKRDRRYNELNADHLRELHAAQYRRNRDAYRSREAARRARVHNAPVVERISRQAIITRDNGTCYLCGCHPVGRDLTLDHVIPLARGGNHTADNLRVCCAKCNARKYTRLFEEMD